MASESTSPFRGGRRNILPFMLLVLAASFGASLLTGDGATTEDLTYTQFVDQVESGEVSAVTLRNDGVVEGELGDGDAFTSAVPLSVQDDELLTLLEQQGVEVDAAPAPTPGLLTSILASLLPFVLLGGIVYWFVRRARKQGGGGMNPLSGMGRSSAKQVTEAERPATRFDDVAGYEGVKQEVFEVVDYLRDPSRYKAMGAKGPGGVLLAGPPGTGKTLLARAVAGEAEVPFISAAGSEFVEMLVGVGASRVRDLFKKAREVAPAIIFVDELDSLGRRRGGGNNIGSNQEQEQTLNQLLAEMDGFEASTGIVVFAATNRPEMLDDALTRPGRFDRRIDVTPPSLADRRAILDLHARGKKLDEDVDLDRVARGTPGFSGAELANLLNEGALVAVRERHPTITREHIDAARDRLVLGRRDDSVALTVEEQHRVAVHEGGHALVAALREAADPVNRISIVNAGHALGATHQLPLVERHLLPESHLLSRIDVALGGRVAELLLLGEASSGAANDLRQATGVATAMVRDLGLSERMGPVGYHDPQEQQVPPSMRSRPFAEATQRALDEEVARLMREGQDRVAASLTEHRAALEKLVEILIDEEIVDGDVVYDLVGRDLPQHPEMVERDVD